MATQDQINDITALYAGYFDRAPDPAGLQFWIDQIDGGRPFNTIAEDFAGSPEAVALYPYLTTPGVSSPAAFVTSIYANLFNRAPDAAGLAFWTGVLADGSVSVADMIEAIINGAVDDAVAGTFDQSTLENKILVGLDFAEKTSNVPNYNFDTPEAKAAAIAALDGVTNDPATVDAAKLEIDAYIADGANPGDTVTLTTGIDNLAGTAANDMFIAANNGGAVADGTTLNTGDTVNGGAGIDTLQIIQSAATAVRVPNLSNVENIDGQAFGSAIALNLATSTGVEKISLSNGNNGLTATNVANIVDLELNNTTTGASILSVTYNAATIGGTADVQNVSVNSAVGAVTVNGIETMNVTSTGAATATGAFPDLNQLAITAAGLKTLNVSGSGLINITNALGASVKTLDASASTGGVYAEFGAAADVTVTGGSGDDAFAFNGTLNADDAVDGGEGFDTVGVTGGDFSLATNATLKGINALTNVERVSFNGADAGTTINGATFANAGLTHVLFNTWDTIAAGDGKDVINNADAALTYQFGTANGDSASFALKAGATSLIIELDGTNGADTVANDGSDADIGGLSIVTAGANSTTTPVSISLASNGDLADAFLTAGVFQSQNYNETGAVTVAAGSTVDVTGDGNLAIFGGTAGALTEGFAHNVTLDASALSGNSILVGSDFSATAGAVGATAQVLTTGDTGVDSFTLGSGADIVVFTTGAASGIIETTTPGIPTTTVATGNVFHDVITGFDTASDLLSFGAVLANAVAADAYTAITAGIQTAIDAFAGGNATLLNAANAAAAGATVGDWTAFSFQGQTYALFDSAAATPGATVGAFDNTDVLVQLVGVNVADLSDANFA